MDGNFNLEKWNDRDGLLNQRVCKISSLDEAIVLDGFLYHYLKPVFKRMENEIKGGTVKHLSAGKIKEIEIPILPLSVQRRIVAILDQFTTLVNDLTQGLPAEIAAVREQYEYYRNKLLTFPPAV